MSPASVYSLLNHERPCNREAAKARLMEPWKSWTLVPWNPVTLEPGNPRTLEPKLQTLNHKLHSPGSWIQGLKDESWIQGLEDELHRNAGRHQLPFLHKRRRGGRHSEIKHPNPKPSLNPRGFKADPLHHGVSPSGHNSPPTKTLLTLLRGRGQDARLQPTEP